MVESWFTYEMWLLSIFDDSMLGWHSDDDEEQALWELSKHPETIAEWITRVFQESGKLPELFTDEQIAEGLYEIVSPGRSDWMFMIFDIEYEIALEKRLQCIESIYVVYEQLYTPRCSPILGHRQYKHTSETNPLNFLCYMWWDVAPVHGNANDPRYAEIHQAILDVLAKTLTLDSAPCCEGALHGLGHMHHLYPKKVEAIIDAFLAEDRDVSRELQGYGKAAREGAVM